MRIVHFTLGRCNPDCANGVDKTVYYLSKTQASMGHQVSVVSLTRKDPLPIDGVQVQAFAPTGNRFSLPGELTRAIHTLSPDVVHFHSVFIPENIVLARHLRRLGIPYVVTPNGGLAPQSLQRNKILKRVFKAVTERKFWDGAAFVHAVSDYEPDGLKAYGINGTIVIAPNGIDPSQVPHPSTLDRSYLGRVYPQTRGKRVFLFLGRLDPSHKGLDLLLEAYAKARDSLQASVLMLVGPDWRGSRLTLERQAHALGIGDAVIFTGPRYGQEKFDILAGCDIFVQVSRWEGLPFGVLEALAAGKPSLVTLPVGFASFITKHQFGAIAETTVESIAAALQHFASLSSQELTRMGCIACDMTSRHFCWTRTAEALSEAYVQYGRNYSQSVASLGPGGYRSAEKRPCQASPGLKLNEFLEAATDYVVLRNHDIGAHLARGGDVDLLVSEQRDTEQLLVAHLGPPLWKAARSYVCNYFYHWGHIDLLPSLEWHGAIYLPAETVLRGAQKSHLGWGKPRLAHEALVSWFSSLLWGGFFRDRYRDVIVDAARNDGAAFGQALIHAVGRPWGERLRRIAAEGRPETSVDWVSPLRRAVFCRALRREPLRTLRGWFAFWLAEICLRLRPSVPWVAILGPDGSGKTTVLETLRARSPRVFVGVNVFHWRPGVIRPWRGAGPVTNPHAQRARGFFVSIAKLAGLLLDWIVGYWTRLVHLRAKGYLVAFDRHYLDIMVDPVRYRYGGPAWLARLAGRLVPKPDLVMLLDAPVELLRRRKQEVPAEETARQRKAYLDLVRGLRNGHVVDASKSPPEVVSQVEEIIFDWMARRAPRFEGVKVPTG